MTQSKALDLPVELSFVIPCLNESLCLGSVLRECFSAGRNCDCTFEVLVADNGSTDGSVQIAQEFGARVVQVRRKGYGEALMAGIDASYGQFVIMGDADGTYAFSDAPLFLALLRAGNDLVMGNRFKGYIEKGAMPVLHQYLGNPVLSFLGRIFFGVPVGDFHCGLRAFSKSSICALNLRSSGMEFASEMVIKACLTGLSVQEVPTVLRLDNPLRRPHLRTWRDGWRHLRFMFSFSPKYSFIPLAIFFGFVSFAMLMMYAFELGSFTGVNTLVLASFTFVAFLSLVSEYLSSKASVVLSLRQGRSMRHSSTASISSLYSEHAINRLFRISASSFLVGLVVLLLAFCVLPPDPSLRGVSISLFVSFALVSVAFYSYLLASRLSTASALGLANR